MTLRCLARDRHNRLAEPLRWRYDEFYADLDKIGGLGLSANEVVLIKPSAVDLYGACANAIQNHRRSQVADHALIENRTRNSRSPRKSSREPYHTPRPRPRRDTSNRNP